IRRAPLFLRVSLLSLRRGDHQGDAGAHDGNVVTHHTWASNIFVVTPPLGGVHHIRCVIILGPWPSIQSCCTHRIRQSTGKS
ncbi:hypothetical protein EDB86DRAFT_2935828, partial [Lactarius hatsudake]